MPPRKLRCTLIGGSNTLMGAGYIGQLAAAAQDAGLALDFAANLAIGNTSSLTGLMRLKQADLSDTDLLVVEYALNDTALHGDTAAGLEACVRAHEGILRHALATKPGLRIVSLVLHNQQGPHRSGVAPLPAAIRYLSDWYGTEVVDVHRAFTHRFGAGYPDQPGFYMDPAHYARPVITRLVAEELAAGIARAMAREARPLPLPAPVDPEHFQAARVIACAKALAALPVQGFRNSIYAVEAADLAGGDVEIRLKKGRLLAALFVCVADAAPLRVTLGGTTYELATLRPSIREGKFPFLLATAALDGVPAPVFAPGAQGGAPAGAEAVYRLSLDPPAAGRTQVLKVPGSAPHDGGAGSRLPLVAMMHTGEASVSVLPRAAIPAAA